MTASPYRVVAYWVAHELHFSGPASHYELFQARCRWNEGKGRPIVTDDQAHDTHVLISRAVAWLRKTGYVTRALSPGRRWTLTEAGEDYVRREIARREERERQLAETTTQEVRR